MKRRHFSYLVLGNVLAGCQSLDYKKSSSPSETTPNLVSLPPRSPDEWMQAWLKDEATKDIVGVLSVQRFADPFYVLNKPIIWVNTSGSPGLPAEITVPKGFVTDFASVPRPFWTLFRPDGDYVIPAVVHDYLYWQQDTTKKQADDTFYEIMRELQISFLQSQVLFRAVENLGAEAWEKNTRDKAKGENRIIRRVPEDPSVRWVDWKNRNDIA